VLGRFTPRTIGGHYFFSKTKQNRFVPKEKNILINFVKIAQKPNQNVSSIPQEPYPIYFG
jgi:hypothetical protein